MLKLSALLCLVSFFIVLCSAQEPIRSPYSVITNKLQRFINNSRQAFADGFNDLPPLDPIQIPDEFVVVSDGFTGTITGSTITGITSFDSIHLTILSNGVFIFYLHVPQLSTEGNIAIDGLASDNAVIRATFPDVQLIVTGYLNQYEINTLAVDDLRVNVNINGKSTVKVVGLQNQNMNNYISQYLTKKIASIINNDSQTYEYALEQQVLDILDTIVTGKTIDQLINSVNSLP